MWTCIHQGDCDWLTWPRDLNYYCDYSCVSPLLSQDMSGASRPTWNPAMGSALAPTMQYSSRDLKSHSTLKRRHDLEQHVKPSKAQDDRSAKSNIKALTSSKQSQEPEIEVQDTKDLAKASYEDAEEDFKEDFQESKINDNNNDNTDDDGDSIDEEDDVEALMLELEKIKRERELERLRKEQQEREARPQKTKDDDSHPVPTKRPTSFRVKRRWDDDVVFKHQAKDGQDKLSKKRFVNDMLRSDFHKDFINRYIR